MSPPCVPFFEGNNGGATWTGVTKDEVKVLMYTTIGVGPNCNLQGSCEQAVRPGSICDLDKPAGTDPGCKPQNQNNEHWQVRTIRPMVRYFQNRYQSYDRRVHFLLYAGTGGSAASLRSQAADAYEKVKPFAAVPFADDFTDAMAIRKVLSSNWMGQTVLGGANSYLPNSYFTRGAPYLWSFGPDNEHWVEPYADYVCTKVRGRPVTYTDGTHRDGSPMKGTPRRYAYMWTTQNNTALNAFRDQVRPKLQQCGIQPAVEVKFPIAGNVAGTGGDNSYAVRNVAAMQDARVTTILWFGGLETYTGQVADQQRFYPEIVFAADGLLDGILGGDLQNQNWWSHAWGPSPTLYSGNTIQENPAFQACKEGDPNASQADCETAAILPFYRGIFMTFKAIQAAGPRLTPRNVDRGLHSIPKTSSTHPMIASCYFDPGDYTCVKDSVEHWWDPDALSPYYQGTGCFRMTRGGSRSLPGEWPEETGLFTDTRGPCGAVAGSANPNTGAPAPPQT